MANVREVLDNKKSDKVSKNSIWSQISSGSFQAFTQFFSVGQTVSK